MEEEMGAARSPHARHVQIAWLALAYVALGPRVPGMQHLAIASRLASRALAWSPDVVHVFKPKAHAGNVC